MNQSETRAPLLSVVLSTSDNFATIATTLSYLRAQTICDRIEVVITAPSGSDVAERAAAETSFFEIKTVDVGESASLPQARTRGVREATAPIVAITEDHSYPTPTWAEALVKAHEQPWAAVGPLIANANPDSAASWAQLYLTYGQWAAPQAGGIVNDLPGHNSSYKRALLLEYGPELETMMETETILHEDLRKKGYQLFLNPDAVTHHINITRPASLVKDHLGLNRMNRAEQARGWSPGKRAGAAGKAVAMIPLHLWRAMRMARRAKPQQKPLPALLPTLVFGSVLRGIGEALGYLMGPGNAKKLHWELEFHREKHIAPSERYRTLPLQETGQEPAAPGKTAAGDVHESAAEVAAVA